MGTAKKEASRRTREGKTKDVNIRIKGENFYRSASKFDMEKDKDEKMTDSFPECNASDESAPQY